jgi:hypothetical protein
LGSEEKRDEEEEDDDDDEDGDHEMDNAQENILGTFAREAQEQFQRRCIVPGENRVGMGSRKGGVMSEGNVTTDHQKIRKWAEERGGKPATVKGTGRGEQAGILRLDFEPPDEGLEPISWPEFFEKFEKERLAFLYQDQTADGSTSRFHKFVQR